MVTAETTIPIKSSFSGIEPFFPTPKTGFTRIYDTVIVGGGPAGAYLGYCLTSQGQKPIIIDHPSTTEESFLFTIDQELLRRFPLMQTVARKGQLIDKLHLISPSGHKVIFDEQYKGRFTTISRNQLNLHLLDMAIKGGALFIPEKVISITREQQLWKIRTSQREFSAHILVGADGVNSIVRKTVLKPYKRNELAIGMGYYARGFLERASLMKFFNHRNGFLWIQNNDDKYIIGIIDSLCNSTGLQNDLDNFISEECKDLQPYKKWCALIPQASTPDFFKTPCTGNNWILIGNAAGHVNPATGKGILHALWSADLASQSLMASDLRLYDLLWKKEYGEEFMRLSNPRKKICKPALLDNIIRYAQRSKSLSNIIFDLVTGDRKGNTAGKRLLFKAPRILFEAAVT
ncbi:MAG TPA: NAD(P)/FAD-dependent oxidoreductase [Chitinispirillaceae bacterium]|nr:NAD(P)/FAD-dependent oxidoreductase [Chitinispirillaceae bacterium]